jgi:hypothetical protein
VVALLLALTLVVQDSGAFVVQLGNDTLSLEQYKRTATQLRGEYVIRSPRSLHRIYTADLNPDGTIRRVEVITHNIGGGPGPAETKLTIEFVGDTAVWNFPRGDSMITQKIAAPRGTLPYQIHVYGLIEQYGRWFRGTGKDSAAFTALASANQMSGGYVKKLGGDTLQLMFSDGQLAGLGPFKFRLDAQGRLVWLTGKGSTVQVDVQRVASVPMAQATQSFASRPLGQLSVRDTARTNLQGAEVWIDYSRPQKRGREIFGNVVPWNAVWRTGANAATQLYASGDIVIGADQNTTAMVVRGGKYTLWTLPTPTGWKVIINKQTGQWGTEYSPELDLIRIDAKVETLATPVEQMTIAFEPANMGSVLSITWDRTRVSVPVSKHW